MTSQTNIDDRLLQMISPKINEIEERFSRGEGLKSEDINTLLLKSQFNHINHLDSKLNEVTADVANLRLEFGGLKSDFSSLKSDFSELKSEFASFKYEVKTEIGSLKVEISSLKVEISGLKVEIAGIKTDIANLKTDIQSAINKNMQWSIGLITFIVTALKIIDTIWHR